MGDVLKRASKPVITVEKGTTVESAVRTMVQHRIGAVLVMEREKICGIFTERDLMEKVVLGRLDPSRLAVEAVMTTPVLTAHVDGEEAAAIDTMVDRHIRHLPVVDQEERVVGMLSFRHLMADRIEDLRHEVVALESYLSYDGATG